MRRTPFGEMSFIGSLGRKEVVGALLSRGELMVLGTRVWKEIMKEWDTISTLLVFSLGYGKRLRFWKDAWSGEEALSISYPSLFALAANKEASVADVWEPSKEGGGCTPCFVRPFNDWEVKEIQNLLQAIQDKRILPSQDDLMLMREARDGCFSVKLLYKVLVRSNSIVFPPSAYLEYLGSHQGGFFFLGSFLEQSVDS